MFDNKKLSIAVMFILVVPIIHTWMIATNVSPAADFQQPKNNYGPQSQSSSDNSYSLAMEQSSNFFNDILTTHWKRLQRYHAALFPNYHNDMNKY